MTQKIETLAITAQDGLRLGGRRFHADPGAGDDMGRRRTVVCLAGLTRNGRDFNALAEALSSGAGARDVYTFDMRGRGLSEFAKDWKTYTIMRELGDTVDLMTACGLFDVTLIGTSRGGLIGMGLMAMQPTRLGALVLNDIGPVIDTAGLTRISSYAGVTPTPSSWEHATEIVKTGNQRHFPDIADDEWEIVARQWFNTDETGKPTPGYDTDIAKTFEIPSGGFPELWPQFKATTRIPCLTIRGANSDILSAETVKRMAEFHPIFQSHEVPGQGHAPLLRDNATIGAVRAFLDDVDQHRPPAAH